MAAARRTVSTAHLLDGWLLDSNGAVYDIRFRASTTRVMNVQEILQQLLFIDKHPLVFFYERRGAEETSLSHQRLPAPTGVFATGPDALTLFHRLFLDFFPARAGKEPHYPTERLAPSEQFVISSGFTYDLEGGANSIRFRPGDRVEFVHGDGAMDILARSPASEKKAWSVFIDAALRAFAKDPALFQPGTLVVLPDGSTGSIVHAYESGAFEIELSVGNALVTLSEGQFEPLVSLADGWAAEEVR